jgi:hypothetical protein
MAAIGTRRPSAQVLRPSQGGGLGLAVVTPLPTRQWDRPARRAFQQVPIDWRPYGGQLSFGTAAPAPAAPDDCEGCGS